MREALITNYGEAFSATWPEVARRLRARLLRKGVPSCSVDDVLQETAAAALLREVPFATTEELLAWSTTVGARLAIAEYRKTSRTVVRDVPATVVPSAVEDQAIARLTLTRLLEAVEKLTPAQRAALSATPTDLPRRDAVRSNLQRHRARSHLKALGGGLWGGIIVVARRLKDLVMESPNAVLAGTALVGASVVAVVSWMPELDDRAPPRAAKPHAESFDAVPRPQGQSGPAAGAAIRQQETTSDNVDRPVPPRPTSTGAVPAADVSVPTPTGADGRVFGRPREPDEPELCVTAIGAGPTCVDVPFPPTPLDDL